MKTIRASVALLAATLVAVFGCNKQDLTSPAQRSNSGSLTSNSIDHICGEPYVYNLIDCNNQSWGTVSVSNDDVNLFVTFTLTGTDYKISKADLVIGTLEHVTAATNDVAWPKLPKGPNPPDFTQEFKPQVSSYTFTIPLANYDDCFDINAWAKIVKKQGNGLPPLVSFIFLQSDTKTGSKAWSAYKEYCKQDCAPPCGQLTTYTQGGYGNDNGNGTGTQYMIANFAAAFPNGVTIGCSSGYTLTMTSAAAVQAYLPSGSTPEVLTQNWVDNGPDNVLSGQMLTLALTIGFDNYDPNFGAGQQHLTDMVIASGDFQGMTVGQFFEIANEVLGGCNTDYTPDQINSTADSINNNYDNGTQDLGFLTCPNN